MIGNPIYFCVQAMHGQIVVSTTRHATRPGEKLTDTESVAMALETAAKHLVGGIDHTPEHVAPVALCRDLLDPEALGHAACAEIRARAREVLGITATHAN